MTETERIPKLPVQLVEHVGGHRYVTVFEPELAIAKMRLRGFALVGWEGEMPVFAGASDPVKAENYVYEADYLAS